MNMLTTLPLLLIIAPTGIIGFSHQTEGICGICTCTDQIIDCHDEKLNKSFEPSEWLKTNTSHVTEAIFDSNRIGHVIRFPTLPLIKLSFRNNRIVRIDDRAFLNLTSLAELNLSYNQLTSNNLLPSVFEGHYDPVNYEPLNIKILDLSANELHTLHQDLFEHLPFLQRLYLKKNPFKILDKPTVVAISSLPNLQVLDLSFTQIKELPVGFLHTPRNLHELVLKGNLFTEVPTDVLAESHDLRILNLNENPIKVISSKTPFPRIALTQLHISYMPNLTRIETGSLSNLINLNYLDCRMNERLSHISPSALIHLNGSDETWPKIVKLDLSDNALRYLDKDLLKPVWSRIRHLNIVGNPLVCDCENQWIVSELIPLMMNISSAVEGMECAEPVEMKGQRLLSLYHRNYTMRCLDAYGARPENDGPILISIFVIVILSLVLALIIVLWVRNHGCRKGGRVNYQRAFYRPASMEEPDKY